LAARLVGDPNIRGKPEINGFRITAVMSLHEHSKAPIPAFSRSYLFAVMQLADPIVLVCGTLAFAAVAAFSWPHSARKQIRVGRIHALRYE